jgi:hypothetical protein
MEAEKNRNEETEAMERVVTAILRVKTAFTALQMQFPPNGEGRPSKFALQTFDTALQELEDAQTSFDNLLGDLLDGQR